MRVFFAICMAAAFGLPVSICGCKGRATGIRSPGTEVRDLAWDGEFLWSVHSDSRRIYKIDTRGRPVKFIECPIVGPRGLAHDGENLWVSTIGGTKIIKMSPDGEVLSILQGPGNRPSGLAWSGKHLYYVETHGDIRKLDPETGEILQTIPAPGQHHEGLAFDGRNLLLVDSVLDKVFSIDPGTGHVLEEIDLKGNPVGITYDGSRFWISYPAAGVIEPMD